MHNIIMRDMETLWGLYLFMRHCLQLDNSPKNSLPKFVFEKVYDQVIVYTNASDYHSLSFSGATKIIFDLKTIIIIMLVMLER